MPLQLTVTNETATSSPVNVTVNPVEPGLLAPAAFQIGGKQHPGDTLRLFGFGSVTPDSSAGQSLRRISS